MASLLLFRNHLYNVLFVPTPPPFPGGEHILWSAPNTTILSFLDVGATDKLCNGVLFRPPRMSQIYIIVCWHLSPLSQWVYQMKLIS